MAKEFVEILREELAKRGEILPLQTEAVLLKPRRSMSREERKYYDDIVEPLMGYYFYVLKERFEADGEPELLWRNIYESGERVDMIDTLAGTVLRGWQRPIGSASRGKRAFYLLGFALAIVVSVIIGVVAPGWWKLTSLISFVVIILIVVNLAYHVIWRHERIVP